MSLFIFIKGGHLFLTKGDLWQIQIDNNRRTMTLNYLRFLSDYEDTISLDEIKQLIYKEPKHPYFLLKNREKIKIVIHAEVEEIHQIVHIINEYLGKSQHY